METILLESLANGTELRFRQLQRSAVNAADQASPYHPADMVRIQIWHLQQAYKSKSRDGYNVNLAINKFFVNFGAVYIWNISASTWQNANRFLWRTKKTHLIQFLKKVFVALMRCRRDNDVVRCA